MKKQICPICKKEFTPKVHNQLYCNINTCALTARNRRRRIGKSKDSRPRDSLGRLISYKETLKLEKEESIKALQRDGYIILKQERKIDKRFKIDLKRFSSKSFKFAIVSDTHFGSRYQQITHLHTFYKLVKEEGIDTVLHCGDISDGNGKIYRGHEYEIFRHGADAQKDYVIANYPKEEGVTTHFIGGNHDESFWRTEGFDLGKAIAREREDMKYLGLNGAYINLAGLSIYLHHPSGGVAYARSYKIQKLIEQFAPEQKPNIVFQGHYHIGNILEMYRNVEGYNMGCFQSQTPYLKAKGLYPTVAGRIITITPDESAPSGLAKIINENIPFYKMLDNDF